MTLKAGVVLELNEKATQDLSRTIIAIIEHLQADGHLEGRT